MVTLYVLSFSHPSIAARLMLEQAGIAHEVVTLPPGFQPLLLRARGFGGSTVPAIKMEGRRVQGSLEISRAIHARAPEAGLFPADPEARRRVEEAESWGEALLQPIPRRLFRWALARSPDLRRRLAERQKMPLPGVAARLLKPITRHYAKVSSATDAAVRADLQRLPTLLDRVDAAIADGTLGGEPPNAADYQIGTALRAILAFEDLAPFVTGRPAEALAFRIVPTFPGGLPRLLPEEWLA